MILCTQIYIRLILLVRTNDKKIGLLEFELVYIEVIEMRRIMFVFINYYNKV